MPAILPTVLPAVVLVITATLLLAWLVGRQLALGPHFLQFTLGLLVAGALLVLRMWRRSAAQTHPFASVGAANYVTLLRCGLIVLMASLLVETPTTALQWVATALAILAAVLDSVDGWIARRTRMSSRFGARLDMETDALLVLVLSLIAWRLGRSGPWLMLAGLLRYAFIAASLPLQWMRRPLPDSRRRKRVAAALMTAMIVVISPFVPWPVAMAIGATALAALLLSFAIDVHWLWKQRRP
ncbi:MAG: CDP-alcohol phosphatidyltransferase family protein [Steroidobacteraceae bacterium]